MTAQVMVMIERVLVRVESVGGGGNVCASTVVKIHPERPPSLGAFPMAPGNLIDLQWRMHRDWWSGLALCAV
jgi:hypothetical protein